ncbi:glycoside hydrolase family 19 protein [Novosphingobium sp. FGD1]|uniref:Glycoside hydrolase family 19 protein n=1 Tax=Novosphingobium silvae TaxID=2692619 RepID=A0A7X4GGX5_9SPHN|nr:glycoside hydrolase family 19 protein [Novosphingobium silvae]MYL98397.1 glycoside hydrolase family 19 protein [Novosphingobium silvae]
MTPKLTPEILKAAFPRITPANAKMVAQNAPKAMAKFNITGVRRVSAFLAQCAHESALFTARVENLWYSAHGLQRVFPRYFPTRELAEAYAYQPSRIAARVYANRMGNGDEKSGQGWVHRGSGFIQLTGKANQTAFAKAMGKTLEETVEYLKTDEGAFMSAAWFWSTTRLNDLADGWQITLISSRINGKNPAHGLAERKAYSNSLLKAFAI